jgi:hypothetical protein
MTKTKAKREPTYLLDCVVPPTDVTADGFLAKHRYRDLFGVDQPVPRMAKSVSEFAIHKPIKDARRTEVIKLKAVSSLVSCFDSFQSERPVHEAF